MDLKPVNDMYNDLVKIADDIVAKSSKDIDSIIYKIKHSDLDTISSKSLASFMLQLQIESYYFGSKKDHAALKQACADAICKEKFAKSYVGSSGTAANRHQLASIDVNEQQVVKVLFDATSNLMKTKLDEAHRMINVLNSIIITRNAEARAYGNNIPNRE